VNDAPIGIFDSGVGGLTVARAILDQLPGERLLYIGDTANSPYGPKPLEQVRSMALNVMDELVDSGVKMLVIACNTATAAALDEARERYTKGMGIPVIEVISPAARTAAALTRSGRVGVIATAGTVNSGAYARALQGIPGLNLTQQACPRFVQLAEAGITTGPQVLDVAKEYLEPLQAAAVDTLVLGCTHYPLLAGPISYVMGRNVALVSSSEETAKDVYRELAARDLLHSDTQAAVGSGDDDGAAGTGVAGGVAGSAAFGADGVIIPQRRSADVNATVWTVSAGAAARVPVAKETNLVRTLEAFKARGCFVVGLDGNASVSVDNLNLADQPLVLVTGAEGKGLSRLVRETCDEIASINIRAAVESLNAAVATGIALYEVDRVRRTTQGN